jgi:hypothetical protein
VQVLLPVQTLNASPPRDTGAPSLQTASWFADCDPRARVEVRVTLDSGQDLATPSAAPEMLRWMREADQDGFRCAAYSLTDHPPLAGTPPFGDHFWGGPPLHRATFSGTLAEWSLDALGWLAAFLADGSARHGVATPVLLTATPMR